MENIVKDLFLLPEWTKDRRRAFSRIELDGWSGGSDAKRMNERCGGSLFSGGGFSDKFTPISIGYDQGQICSFKSHSTGVVCLK